MQTSAHTPQFPADHRKPTILGVELVPGQPPVDMDGDADSIDKQIQDLQSLIERRRTPPPRYSAEQVAALLKAATAKAISVAAELHEELLQALVRTHGAVVLPCCNGTASIRAKNTYLSFSNEGGRHAIDLFLLHGEHQGAWFGNETRDDEVGRSWSRRLQHMRPDDFGTLFEAAR